MPTSSETTQVGIVGAGVAGLTLATMLTRSGVSCVVLERRDRAYVEQRQRAGVVESRAAQMFERWDLADQLLAGPVAQTIDYRINGVGRLFEIATDESGPGRFCTQQMLINNLLRELLDVMAGDVRFEAAEVAIDLNHSSPRLSYTDPSGTAHEVSCDYVVGADGDRGVSRAAIPTEEITEYRHDFGYAWLAALVEAPVTGHSIMGVSDHGFVGQLPRGPQRSRYYLQCALGDGPDEWPDERVWDEIRLRLCDDSIEDAPVLDKFFVALRSVVYAPMRYGKLFLAGDAAHLVPPASAKGMNLALYDVDILGQALLDAVRHGDDRGLDAYSDTCLQHTWKYQEFGVWMTDTMHDAGDVSQHGAFRQRTARARLDELFTSPTAALMHSQFQQGTA